ncbi:MAG: ATP-binding protein [Solirubrobacteraceae bacterium]
MTERRKLPPGQSPPIAGEPVTAMAARKKQPTQAKRLMTLAQAQFDVIADQYGTPYAIPKTSPRIAVPLEGKGQSLTNHLRRAHFEKYGSLPTGQNVTGVAAILGAAAADEDRVPIHLRCASVDDGLIVDLGDPQGRAIVVRDGSWKVEKSPPDGVLFRRTKMTAALPTPKRGGSLDELRELINVSDEGWDLVRAWLVLAWTPNVPVPILCITGQQGSGKSVLGRTLVSLVDPSPAPLRSVPGRIEEWQTTAAASRVVGLDNISRIKEEMSDAFCRASTGEGAAKRELWTNEDLILQSFRRALLLTSIDPGALKGDLGERLVPVELLRPTTRRGEAELDRVLDRRRGRILGAILDLVADALANPVKVKNPPRMADAANVMAAVDRATGGRSLDAYRHGQANVAATVLESDPLVSAVLELMKGRDEWKGTPTALHDAVMGRWDPDVRNRPSNARGTSERLKRLAPAMLDVHDLVVEHRRGDKRTIDLRRRKPAGRRVRRRRKAGDSDG